MEEQRTEVALSELMRWLAVGIVILLGIGLYFRFAGETHPAVSPAVEETGR